MQHFEDFMYIGKDEDPDLAFSEGLMTVVFEQVIPRYGLEIPSNIRFGWLDWEHPSLGEISSFLWFAEK